MSGTARFELSSSSSDSSLAGNYQNGRKGYSAPVLDRSASFREGAESRTFGSGKVTSRGIATSSGNVPTLSQSLMLEPIAMSDKKYSWFGELRRILAFTVGNGTEDNSFGAAHLKNSPPVAMEEIKRLRASVADTCVTASGRAKKVDGHLNKLNNYCEAMTSKKQQRNDLLTNERSSNSSLKIVSHTNRNPSELANQKLDNRPKNVVLNKRARTSVADTRVECRNNGVPRQPLVVTKERDLLKDKNSGSDHVEEKVRRLPAGGEGWDKKMKRKRSIGSVFSRSTDNEREPKRAMHQKLTNESSVQLGGSTHGFRSGASVGSHKLDPTSSPAGSNASASLKSEQEISVVTRDLSAGPNKERSLGKANVRLNNRNDNHSMPSSPIIEGNASRAPQSGSMVSTSSASNICRTSVTLESWEQSQCANKYNSIGEANNGKRAMSIGSSSPPITNWVGQRPQKISRTRRTNLIPVSNSHEVQIQSEGCSPSDFGPRLSNHGTNSSHVSKSAGNGNQHFKVGPKNVPSPVRLCEKEESGVIENRLMENGVGSFELQDKATNDDQIVGPFLIPPNKNKIVVKEEIGNAVRRQGRSGRASQCSRDNISPTGEKLDNVTSTNPLRNARSGFDRSRSKSGRPLKKLSDRKGSSHLGLLANGDSPDFRGEPEDDHEELLSAAHLAYKSSFNACSSSFWKTVEKALFSSIGPDEISYLSQQLKLAEELNGSTQNCSHDANTPVKLDPNDYGHEEIVASDPITCEENGCIKNEQCQNPSLFGSPDVEKRNGMVTPLLQRLLSALIVEDEIEESEETGFRRSNSSDTDRRLLIGNESRHMSGLDVCESIFGVRTQKNGNTHIVFSCNGNMDFSNSTDPRDHLCNGEMLQRDGGYVHSEVEVSVRLSRYNYVPQSLLTNNCGISSFNYYYEQMHLEYKVILELHSIGLFPETMVALIQPTLDDKDVVFNQEILQLERGLREQMEKKKSYLNKIHMVAEDGNDVVKWNPEQVAMDKLVELAYKKLLATRGSFASKHGIAKVSKQGALAFAKRTLARCKKFEDSGASCFAEPTLQDIVYAEPVQFGGSLLDEFKTSIHQSNHAFAKNGPISNKEMSKEVLLDDDVGSSALRASSSLGSLGGAKGKRSDRDRDGDGDGDFSTRIAFSKAGRSLMGGSKSERKTKSKPKQKTTQLSASGIGFVKKVSDTTDSVHPSASGSCKLTASYHNRKKDVGFMSSRNGILVSSKEMKESVDFSDLPLNDITGIEELGVDSDIGAPQDLNSWFNFDVDGLQDIDSAGLEIPMDDISELNMF